MSLMPVKINSMFLSDIARTLDLDVRTLRDCLRKHRDELLTEGFDPDDTRPRKLLPKAVKAIFRITGTPDLF